MPRVPRLQLSPEFRAAVKNDPRGVVRLSHLIGLNGYTQLTRLINPRRISGTVLSQGRLRQLATEISFTGEVFRG